MRRRFKQGDVRFQKKVKKREHTVEAHSVRKCASVIFALRRVILLRSDIMLRIVILSFGQFKGEYNIAVRPV